MMYATKTLLYHQQQVWIKINNNKNNKLFSITMRGKYGAENCDLVGLYILNSIKSKLNGIKVGIHSDDGLRERLIKIQVDQISQKSRRKCTNMQTK